MYTEEEKKLLYEKFQKEENEKANDAFNRGLIPFEWINQESLDNANIKINMKILKWIYNEKKLKSVENHYMGSPLKSYNFIDLNEIHNLELKSIIEEYEWLERAKKYGCYAFVRYKHWIGYATSGSYETFEDYAFVFGKMAYIDCYLKKRLSGSYFKILKRYKIKPRGFDSDKRDRIFEKLNIKQ